MGKTMEKSRLQRCGLGLAASSLLIGALVSAGSAAQTGQKQKLTLLTKTFITKTVRANTLKKVSSPQQTAVVPMQLSRLTLSSKADLNAITVTYHITPANRSGDVTRDMVGIHIKTLSLRSDRH